MRRIAIVGRAGAGKSTLAQRLGAQLDLPVYHLDSLYWRPGWVATPADEWERFLRATVASERWIIDGSFSGSMRDRFDAADTIVLLDLPAITCMFGVIKRRILHDLRPAPGIQPGCRPLFNLQLFRWIWGFRAESRGRILALLAEQPSWKRQVVLRNRRDVRLFIRSAADAASPAHTTPAQELADAHVHEPERVGQLRQHEKTDESHGAAADRLA